MEPDSLRGRHVLVAHQHQGPVALFTLPPIQQVSVDLSLFQSLMHQREEFLQHLMEGQELVPLVLSRNGYRLALHHRGQFPCAGHGPLRVRIRLICGLFARDQ